MADPQAASLAVPSLAEGAAPAEGGAEGSPVFNNSLLWVEGNLDEFAQWAANEIENARSERSGFEDDCARFERLYEAKPKVANKTFPWPDCANIVVPVVATAVDSIVARMLQSIFGGRELWVTVPRASAWVELASPIQAWINWVGTEVLDMYRTCQRWFMTCAKTGTGIVKLVWETRQRNMKFRDPRTGGVVQELVTTHNGPVLESIHPIDFLMSSDVQGRQDLQRCTWLAQHLVATDKYLSELETSKLVVDVDKIRTFKRSSAGVVEQAGQEATGHSVNKFEDYDLHEIWASYDIDGDGILEEVVALLHVESKTLLRCIYNPYRHQERPFHMIRFMPRDNAVHGTGIAKMLGDIQEEITTIHNQRLDNGTLANTSAFTRKSGAASEIEGVWPGAMLDVEEQDDIQRLEMGDTGHSSMLAEELHSNAIGEKRSGVSDYTVGRESAAIGSNATATSTLALIQEGNKRFAMTNRDIREALGNISHQLIMLYQQFALDNKVMYEIFSEKDKMLVEQFLQLPPEMTRANVVIDVPALSETQNKDADKQGFLMLLKITNDFYSAMMMAVQMAENPMATPGMKQLASEGAIAGTKMFKRVLEAFNFRDPETFVPKIEELLMMAQQMEAMNAGTGQSPGGAGAMGVPGGGPPMAAPGGPPQGQASPPGGRVGQGSPQRTR